jgi:hypothetical protein
MGNRSVPLGLILPEVPLSKVFSRKTSGRVNAYQDRFNLKGLTHLTIVKFVSPDHIGVRVEVLWVK